MQIQPFKYFGQNTQQWDFNSFRVTLTNYPAAQQQPRHRHDNPTFFFLLGGEFVDESDELGTRQPSRFELLYHPSGAWHESRASQRGRVGLNLEPSERWLSENDLNLADLGMYRIEDDPIKGSELLRLLNGGFQESDIENQLLEIVLPKAELESSIQPWQKRLNGLLKEDRTFRWTLKSLAGELAVHPVYLARVFRAQFGCSATTYLLRRRLMNCAKALTEGRPAVDIAFENGFADQSHFARSFRTFYGTPPAEFQRKWLQMF